MFKILLTLFRVANIFAITFLLISCVLTIITKIKFDALRRTSIAIPKFSELISVSKWCSRCGLLFIVMDWLLCSAEAVMANSGSAFSTSALHFATAWAILMFITIVCEVALKFIKLATDEKFSVTPGIRMSLLYALIYFCFSFLTL